MIVMAKRGLFSQFVNSWVRQMGRESAHTAYGDITGKNTRESYGGIKETKVFPAFKDYIKLLLAQLLPIIGPLWAIIKGSSRLISKNIQYIGVVDKNIYKLDRRYSDNSRYVGTQEVKVKLERLKTDSPAKDVKRYKVHAIIYIVIGLLALIFHGYLMALSEREKENEAKELALYTKWHSVELIDEFTEKTTSYDMLYPTIDSIATDKVVLMKQNGKYFLLSSSSSLFSVDYSNDSAPVDIKTVNGVKSLELKTHPTETKYMTPLNKSKSFPLCLLIPSGIVPSKGNMQIRSKDKIYTFDLDK